MPAKKNARASPEKASLSSADPDAVLHDDRTTQSALSRNAAMSDAVSNPSSPVPPVAAGVSASAGSANPGSSPDTRPCVAKWTIANSPRRPVPLNSITAFLVARAPRSTSSSATPNSLAIAQSSSAVSGSGISSRKSAVAASAPRVDSGCNAAICCRSGAISLEHVCLACASAANSWL